MHNTFMFDGHGFKAYIRKLKGILMGQFWVLENVRIVSSSAYLNFLMVLDNVPLPQLRGLNGCNNDVYIN